MTTISEYLKTDPQLTKAVVAYPVKGEQVMLGLRKKVSFGLGANLISGIGGKVGDYPEIAGESCDEALIRELNEEIGITVTEFKNVGRVIFLFPDKPKWNQDVAVYLVTKWDGNEQETEVIAPNWYNINSIPTKLMWPDNAIWLPGVLNGGTVNMVFLLENDGKVVESRG